MIRIVAMADTHLCHSFDVPDGDVLIHAGDLCRFGTIEELVVATDWLKSLPHKEKILVAGNHDWAFANTPSLAKDLWKGPGLTYLEDDAATVAGLKVYGSPWQPEFCNWAFNLPRGDKLARKWSLIPPGLDVLVTHGPPFYVRDFNRTEHVGCKDLRRRVDEVRPRVHLFGHIHEDNGTYRSNYTLFANVTTDYGSIPPTVINLAPDGVWTQS